MELLFSQSLPPPQYSFTPRRSPAAGPGLEEPGDMQQTDPGGTFAFHVDVDGFFHVDCTRIPEQGELSYFKQTSE